MSIKYEIVGDNNEIAVISLNRPDKANAQDLEMLYALNDALTKAAHDVTIKVIILRAEGKHFSAGKATNVFLLFIKLKFDIIIYCLVN